MRGSTTEVVRNRACEYIMFKKESLRRAVAATIYGPSSIAKSTDLCRPALERITPILTPKGGRISDLKVSISNESDGR